MIFAAHAVHAESAWQGRHPARRVKLSEHISDEDDVRFDPEINVGPGEEVDHLDGLTALGTDLDRCEVIDFP